MIDQFEDLKGIAKQKEMSELQPSQIKEILFSSFSKLAKISPTNSELAKAHQEISDVMKSEHFLATLIDLLIQHQDGQTHANFVKQILTTYTTFVRHQQSRSSLVKKIDHFDLNKKLIQIFFRQEILFKNRQTLLKAYPQFIYANGMETIRTQTIDNLCQVFGVASLITGNDIQDKQFIVSDVFRYYTLYIPLAHMIIKGPIEQNLMKKMLKNFAKPVLLAALKIVNLIQQAIDIKNEPLFIQMSLWGQKFIDFLRDMVVSLYKDYMMDVRIDLLKVSELGQLIKNILSLTLREKANQDFDEVVIDSNGNIYLQRINEMKKNSLDMINTFAKLALSVQDHKKQSSKEQYIMPYQIIKFVLDSIVMKVVEQFQRLQYPKKKLPHKGVFKAFFTALAKITKIFRFYNQSQKSRSIIIFRLCLPLLQRVQSEKIVSAADFKGKKQDILNMHAMDNIQNAVCALIQAYIDKVDGSIFQFSTQIVNMIMFHLTALPSCFQNLPLELVQGYFFKNIDFVIQIECGLTILALLSYMAPNREDLIILVQELLSTKKQFFFKQTNPGTFKCAVLLCYTYYIDNFYENLINGKSMKRQFHLQVLQYCCVYVKQYTQIKEKSLVAKQQLISLQIGAAQAIDCLSNCIGQKLLLPALFWVSGGWTSEINQKMFLNIFQFCVYELQYEMNIQVIDMLIDFYTEAIKNQCQKGFALKRLHYQNAGVPLAIRSDLCTFLCPELYKTYNAHYLPNKKLLKTKIITLLEFIFTCCENPELYVNYEFFNLKAQKEDEWDLFDPLDIFVRRMVQKQDKSKVNYEELDKVLYFCCSFFQKIIKDGEFKKIFGILINLMVINEKIIDKMIEPLGTLLIKLLGEEEQAENFSEQLQQLLQKCSYLLMIAINIRFTEENARIWTPLVELIQNNLAQKSSQGYIVFTSSSNYIGKLLAICLVFIYQMRNANIDQKRISFVWSNTIRYAQVYKSFSEKLIVSTTFMRLLNQKQVIPDTDVQCTSCFKMLCTLLHSLSNNFLKTSIDQENQNHSKSDSFEDSDNESRTDSQGLNYQQYTIICNEYTLKDSKDSYIFALKELCHKLKQNSPQFLKKSLQSLSYPIQNFVKQKVFYFEGNITQQGLRKFIKVKK